MTLRALFEKQVFIRLTDDQNAFICTAKWPSGFVVVVAGNITLMPGLPKAARAFSIDVDSGGNIVRV